MRSAGILLAFAILGVVQLPWVDCFQQTIHLASVECAHDHDHTDPGQDHREPAPADAPTRDHELIDWDWTVPAKVHAIVAVPIVRDVPVMAKGTPRFVRLDVDAADAVPEAATKRSPVLLL